MSLFIKLRKLEAEFKVDTPPEVLATFRVRPILIERILAAQQMDKEKKKMFSDVKNRKVKELSYSKEGLLKYGNRLYMLNMDEFLNFPGIPSCHASLPTRNGCISVPFASPTSYYNVIIMLL